MTGAVDKGLGEQSASGHSWFSPVQWEGPAEPPPQEVRLTTGAQDLGDAAQASPHIGLE